MSRELKFRAWHKILKNYAHIKRIWLDGDGNGHDEIFAVSDAETTYSIHEVVLEQYTGLKDKNGKEIYEGDIVQCGAYKGKVHYSVGVACYCVGDYTPIYQISRIENESFITLKVIGNINENPELLDVKEED